MTAAEAINKLEYQRRDFNDRMIDYGGVNDAYNMAIRSLEGWGKVLDELREYGSICVEYTAEDGMTEKEVDAVVDSVLKQAKQAVLEIINRQLEEVTK